MPLLRPLLIPRPAHLLGIALALSGAGCGPRDDAQPRWIELTEGFTPQLADAARGSAGETGVWQEATLVGADWEALGEGLWRAPLTISGAASGSGAGSLTFEGAELEPLDAGTWGTVLRDVEPGAVPATVARALDDRGARPAYCLAGAHIVLVLARDDAPPATANLRRFLDMGRAVEGRWQLVLDAVATDGIPVLRQMPQSVRSDVPPGSALRFQLALLGGALGREVTARVRLADAVVFEERLDAGPELRITQHAARLPDDGLRDAQLTFEIEGAPATAAFLRPVVGPADVGTYGSRPWGESRPDLVLFLADTFRDDNLAAYGGDPSWTPELNAFAAESLVFRDCRAPSSWTLPSHASMLSGTYPRQMGAYSRKSAMADGAHTLAEHLRAAGYRTVAVTEQGFVSRTYGLAQGFEWFEEHSKVHGLTSARARALLDADDGRPLFLFFHTYRTHHPYVVTDASRARLGLSADDAEQLVTAIEELPHPPLGSPNQGERAAMLDRLEALYRGTAADLDVMFAELVLDLRARGVLPAGALVFTSDHGEAFGEHGEWGHGNGVWEELVRVPLLVQGRGISPGATEHDANLIDLPRTISLLAGIEPWDQWAGQNLFELEGDRPQFLFECGAEAPDHVAWLGEGRKLILEADKSGGVQGLAFAYDLEADPAETENLASEDWVIPLEERMRPTGEALAEQLEAGEPANLGAAHAAQLNGLGYGGD